MRKEFENTEKLKKYIKKRSLIQAKELKIHNSAQSDFMGECIPKLIKEGYDKEQAIAICYSKYNDGKK